MEAAETAEPKKILKEKAIEVVMDNNKTLIQFQLKENGLYISTEIKNSLTTQIYYGTFSEDEIKKNKYFTEYTLEEIFDELIAKSQMKPIEAFKDNDSIKLKIFLLAIRFKDIEFILKPKSKNSEDKFKELYDIVNELKKENTELKKEINELQKLKQENIQIKEQIKILIEFKNKIEAEREREKKHLELDSNILNDDQNKKNKIKEFISPNQKIKAELKYRLTRDGNSFDTFHKLCDNISPNLLLIKDNKNNIFGGFTKASWENNDIQKEYIQKYDQDSFLFSLNKNKKYYPKHKENETIFCYSEGGPWFYGGDIGFHYNNMSQCVSYGTGDYLDESLSTNEAGSYFEVHEVEFYKISFE